LANILIQSIDKIIIESYPISRGILISPKRDGDYEHEKNEGEIMKRLKESSIWIMAGLFFVGFLGSACAQTYESLPGPGKKAEIGKDRYLIYSFNKKPQMGVVILKIELFDKDGKKDSSLQITGNVDMPSMRGAHGSGDQTFQQNAKGDYLLALNLVMPGEWEVQLVFLKDKTVIHRGSIRIRV
jgi:hypothetical protein